MTSLFIFSLFFFSLQFFSYCQFGSNEKYNLTAAKVPKPKFDEISYFEEFSALKNGDQAYHYSKGLLEGNKTIGRKLKSFSYSDASFH